MKTLIDDDRHALRCPNVRRRLTAAEHWTLFLGPAEPVTMRALAAFELWLVLFPEFATFSFPVMHRPTQCVVRTEKPVPVSITVHARNTAKTRGSHL